MSCAGTRRTTDSRKACSRRTREIRKVRPAPVRAALAALPGVEIADPSAAGGAIVTFTVPGRDSAEVRGELSRQGVHLFTVPAAHGPWDLAPRGLPAVPRASVHVYNDEGDVGAPVEAVRGSVPGVNGRTASISSKRTLPESIALAAPHPEAVRAGEAAVAAGGNAMDAALAAAACLTVVYPHQCALGGDLVALVHQPDGRVETVLSVGAAPAAVDVEALRAMDGRMPQQGPHSVTVPGILAGWCKLAAVGHATLGLEWALARAAGVARSGTPVSAGLSRAIYERRGAIEQDAGLRALFAPGGSPLEQGDLLVQNELATTLDELADGQSAFYQGEIGQTLAGWLSAAGSSLSASDFAAHTAIVETPLSLDAGGTRWWVAPPPSQGVSLLALLDAVAESGTAPSIELCRAANHARDRLLGDPRRGPIDLAGLLHPARDCAEPADRQPRPSGDTVAIVAMDDAGFAVSLIQSVYQWFGAGLLEPETGIILHNRGSAFSLVDGHPGVIGPGLRPPHTLCPVVGVRPDSLLVAGCQGGRGQPQIMAQVVADLVRPDSELLEVIARPRRVVGARDLGYDVDTVLAEPGAPPVEPDCTLPVDNTARLADDAGHVQAARLSGGAPTAASDPRADGHGTVVPTS